MSATAWQAYKPIRELKEMTRDVDRLSAQQLQDTRQLWWDDHFSQFLWSRLQQHQMQLLLDAGCGVGTFFQRMVPFFSERTNFLGVDIDDARLQIASQQAKDYAYLARLHLLASDLCSLPLKNECIDAAITVLTLQHIEQPELAIAELWRVTRREGVVVCVEPDNLRQCISLPRHHREFQEAQAGFWSEVRAHYLPRDIALGLRLPLLLTENGYRVQATDGYLITHVNRESPQSFTERSKKAFLGMGEKYELAPESAVMQRLLEAIAGLEREYLGFDDFYTIATIPLFLAEGVKNR
ncbi:MAG: class I SAM-dependent methyltransferase [Acidobacteriota bacterium]